MEKGHQALHRAIQIAGGQTALANAIGVRQSHISYWLRKSDHGVPAERVADIERITGIARHELRPDLFPESASTVSIPTRADTTQESRGSSSDRPIPPQRSGAYFSCFKHLRRAHFSSAEEIDRHIRALREEWDRR